MVIAAALNPVTLVELVRKKSYRFGNEYVCPPPSTVRDIGLKFVAENVNAPFTLRRSFTFTSVGVAPGRAVGVVVGSISTANVLPPWNVVAPTVRVPTLLPG